MSRTRLARSGRVVVRAGRLAASVTLILVLSAALAELCLQVASLFVQDRATGSRPGGQQLILCVGDSHTWGGGVSRDEAYPAQLQRLLDDEAPGVYSVVNVGLPGMNTAQVRRRLPVWLARYQPDTVILWVGVNNLWNVADFDHPSGLSRLEGFASRSRLYRLLRVWAHDRQLERYAPAGPEDPRYEIVERPSRRDRPGAEPRGQRWVTRTEGVLDTIEHVPADEDSASGEDRSRFARARHQAERDYEAVAQLLESAGVRLLMIAYPLEIPEFAQANDAMRSVARSRSVPLLPAARSVERIPPERRRWLWALHPSAPMYAEIAKDVVREVRRQETTTPDGAEGQ